MTDKNAEHRQGNIVMSRFQGRARPILQTSIKPEPDLSTRVINAFELYHHGVGADGYISAVFNRPDDDSNFPCFMGGRPSVDIDAPAYTSDVMKSEILAAMVTRVEHSHLQSENAYYRPVSKMMHHLLIDDVTAENLARIRSDGYRPAYIHQSSGQGNYQVIINVPKFVDADHELNRRIGNQLIRALNGTKQNPKYGDPQLFGSDRLMRAPGFRNAKPAHRRADPEGRGPIVTVIDCQGGICPKSTGDAARIRAILIAEDLVKAKMCIEAETNSKSITNYTAPSDVSLARLAYAAHMADLDHYDQNTQMLKSMQRMLALGWAGITVEFVAGEALQSKAKYTGSAAKTLALLEEPHNQAEIFSLSQRFGRKWYRLEVDAGARPVKPVADAPSPALVVPTTESQMRVFYRPINRFTPPAGVAKAVAAKAAATADQAAPLVEPVAASALPVSPAAAPVDPAAPSPINNEPCDKPINPLDYEF